MYKPRFTFPILFLVGLLSACATAGGGDGGTAGNRISIRVDNEVVPSANFAISIVPDVGSSTRLGSVLAGSQERMTYPLSGRAQTYHLVAAPQGPGGRQIASRPFPLSPGSTIEWVLSTNRINIIEP